MVVKEQLFEIRLVVIHYPMGAHTKQADILESAVDCEVHGWLIVRTEETDIQNY